MKYENGNWLLQKSTKDFYPSEVYETTIEKDRVSLYLTTTEIRTKADIQGGINLTLEITSPYEDILRLTVVHHKGMLKKGPEFVLNMENGTRPLFTEETDETLTIKSGELSLVIQKRPWSFAFTGKGNF